MVESAPGWVTGAGPVTWDSNRVCVHLLVCQEFGHVGYCDNSPGRHATAHFHSAGHPVIRSYEPGENWCWCYVDQFASEFEGGPAPPSHH
jgi:hypothetical protein